LQLVVELLFALAEAGGELHVEPSVQVAPAVGLLEMGHTLAGELEGAPVLRARGDFEGEAGAFGRGDFYFAAEDGRIEGRLDGFVEVVAFALEAGIREDVYPKVEVALTATA
jgi:hypothetical protein